MNRNVLASRLAVILFFLLLGAAYYHFLCLTPPIMDDYYYHFRILPDGEGGAQFSTLPITNWAELAESLYYLGIIHNWRLANLLYVTITWLGGFPLLDLFNVLFLFALILSLAQLCFRQTTPAAVGLTTLGLMLILAVPDRSLLWHAATVNYLWGGVFLTFLLLILQGSLENGERLPCRKTAAACLLGFLCGWLHEGIALPTIAGFLIYMAVCRIKNKSLSWKPLMTVCLFLAAGAAISMLSPGLWKRASSLNGIGLIIGLAGFFWHCPLAVVALLLLFSRRFKARLAQPYFYLLLMAIGMGIVTNSASTWGGAFFYASYFILILTLASISHSANWNGRWATILVLAASLLLLACYYPTALQINRDFAIIVQRAKEEHPMVTYDYPRKKYVPWKVKASLNLGNAGKGNACRSEFLHVPRFHVIFNTIIDTPYLYHLFDGLDPALPQWKRTDRLTLIRLPKGWDIKNGRGWSEQGMYNLTALDGGKDRIYSLLRQWSGNKEIRLYRTWHDGFFYVVLPEEGNELTKIHLTLVHVNTDEVQEIEVTPHP